MFRDLAEQCLVGVFLFQDGELKYVNPKLAAMHGYTAEEAAEIRREDLIHPDDLPQLDERAGKRLSDESTPEKLIVRGIKKNGGAVYIEICDFCVTTSNGHAAIIGTAVDVTESRKTEEEMKKYREQLEELVEERTSQLSSSMSSSGGTSKSAWRQRRPSRSSRSTSKKRTRRSRSCSRREKKTGENWRKASLRK